MKLRIIVALCTALVSANALAWIDTGHMVVAEIAKRNLKPRVLQECEFLLREDADPRSDNFITASCWADDTKNKTTGPWHYIDYHFRKDGAATENKPDAQNVVWAIEKYSRILSDKNRSQQDRADALRYLIHFVGDIHQPLHATSCDSDAHPDGDKGGNLFKVEPPSSLSSLTRPPRNLHALWDFGCGLFTGETRPLNAASQKHIEELATRIRSKFPAASLSNVTEMTPSAWAQESFGLAKSVAYNLDEETTPSASYIAKGQEVCEERLALAGYRLAALLNSLMGK